MPCSMVLYPKKSQEEAEWHDVQGLFWLYYFVFVFLKAVTSLDLNNRTKIDADSCPEDVQYCTP